MLSFTSATLNNQSAARLTLAALVGLILAVAHPAAAAGCSAPTFGAATNFGVGNDLFWSVAVGNFNGDGHLDLAVANGANSLAVLPNCCAATPTPTPRVPTPTRPPTNTQMQPATTSLNGLLQGTWYYNSGDDEFYILGTIDTISFSPIDSSEGDVSIAPSTIPINFYEIDDTGTAIMLFDLEGNTATLYATVSFVVTQSTLTLTLWGDTGYYTRTEPTNTPTPTTTGTATPTPSPMPTRTPGGPPIVVGNGTAASCTDAALNAGLAGGGVVTFNCGGGLVTIDISTGTGTKTISVDTTIDGGGLITISGGNSVPVFSVNTGVNFTVQNLTIANGNWGVNGGGIYNNGGTLTITNSTVSGNWGVNSGGIENYGGTLTVTNSTFSDNSAYSGGGGITNDSGTLTVTNSTFSGNSAGIVGGGGIWNNATLTITNSTFSGNSVGATYGGCGGIFNSATLTITNSTFSGNSATLAGVGAIDNYSGTLTVTNTIVADSTSGGNCSGPITDGGHNIDDGTTCGFSSATRSLSNTNPLRDLAGLANNGGPTQTIALEAGSPAINAGDETVCAAPPVNSLDQRGYVRPGTGAANCSIGAYEFDSPGPPPSCTGDCDGDGTVTVDEILTLVNIALGNADATACPNGIPSGAQVDVALILTAVNNALNGCS
jgi:hypothetical protein